MLWWRMVADGIRSELTRSLVCVWKAHDVDSDLLSGVPPGYEREAYCARCGEPVKLYWDDEDPDYYYISEYTRDSAP